MQVAERGPRRLLAGIGWVLVALVGAGGIWVSSFMSGIALLGYLGFGVLMVVTLIKAYGAFTGVKRFGPPTDR